jgi:hypothetical protein
MRHGVVVHHVANLHAKVYVSSKRAVVCSANLSEQSREDLIEGGLESKAPGVVAAVRRFVAELCGDEVDEEFVKRLRPLYAKHRRSRRGRRTTRVAVVTSRVWIEALELGDWDENAERAGTNTERTAKKKVTEPKVTRLESFWTYHPAPEFGDSVIQVLRDGRSRYVLPKGRVLETESFRSDRGARRVMVTLGVPKNRRRLSLQSVRKKVGSKTWRVLDRSIKSLVRGRPVQKDLDALWPLK